MKLIIVDLISNNYKSLDNESAEFENSVILSLTPSASYYLESINFEFKSFHEIVSTSEFQRKVVSVYNKFFLLNKKKYADGLFIYIAKYLSYFIFIEYIISFINNNKFDKIVYITDRKEENKYIDLTNESSLLFKYINFYKIIKIEKIENINKINKFYKYNSLKNFKKLFNKIIGKELRYDWSLIRPKTNFFVQELEDKIVKFNISDLGLKNLSNEEIVFNLNNNTSKISNTITFLQKNDLLIFNKLKEHNKFYFFQHGSYFYKNIFLKYSEIEPADVNFVFNNYTKNFFESLSSKKVYTVGSVLFNPPIKDRTIKYDFLYITQGHDYSGNLQYVDFSNSLHSFDGYELYRRHKSIIELFGTKYKKYKIIIRVHPTVVTNGIYVPFWEIADSYENVTIDVSKPIHSLIEKSKYVVSDYFSSEFINRNLHYKRDIILFEGAPTPLPNDTVDDMKKMFILVDTVDELDHKIRNIKCLTKNRKRYDDIIEYYTSKKCDTKKEVTRIYERT